VTISSKNVREGLLVLNAGWDDDLAGKRANKVSKRPARGIWAYLQDVICVLVLRVDEESEGAGLLTSYSIHRAYY